LAWGRPLRLPAAWHHSRVTRFLPRYRLLLEFENRVL
jgi:hypothetical protein